MKHEILNVEDELFNPFYDLFLSNENSNRNNFMRTDIEEDEEKYVLESEVPGVDKKDLNLSLKDGYLTISYKHDNKEEKRNMLRKERYYFDFKRSFYLGDVDEKNVDASLENGILKVVVKKEKREEKCNKIFIR